MNVVFIGSGNVATVLGRLMKAKGHVITEVVSRNIFHAKKLADELHAKASDDIEEIFAGADLYIIAVSDDTIAAIAGELKLEGKMVVHTSGATSKTILKNSTEKYGVLYPLQSLRKETTVLPVIPLFVDGCNFEVREELVAFARTISGIVEVADDDARLKLHVSAVLVSNFTNHLYALTEAFCRKEKMDFAVLGPLIQEVSSRIIQFSPAQMQTGPAIRGDVLTMKKHIQILAGYPQLKKIYEMMSESIRASGE